MGRYGSRSSSVGVGGRKQYRRSPTPEKRYRRSRSPGRRYRRSPSPEKRHRRSRSRSTKRDRYSGRRSSREREYDDRKGTRSSNNAANSRHSAIDSYPPQVSHNGTQRTAPPSKTSQQPYPTKYAAQEHGNHNYNYSKTSHSNGHQQAAGYKNKASYAEEVDEDLMREIKDIFSDVDDDDEKPPPARSSSDTLKGQEMSRACPGNRSTRSDSPSTVPASLFLKIQSQLDRINNIKLLEESIQSRRESVHIALIKHWKLDVEEIYNTFKKEHTYLEANWHYSLMDQEYFSNMAYNQMYRAYSSIRITLADMEQEILKTTEQSQMDSSQRILLTNHLDKLDEIPPQTRNDPRSLNTIASSFAKFRKAVQSLVPKEYLGDCLLIHRMTQLCDQPTREAWNDLLDKFTQIPTFEKFENFLAGRVKALETNDSVSSTTTSRPSTPSKRAAHVSVLKRLNTVSSTRRASPSMSPRRVARSYSRSPQRRIEAYGSGSKESIKNRLTFNKVTRISKHPCSYCMEHHFVVACPSFRLLSPVERRQFITKNFLCFKCLGTHLAKNCMSNVNCKKCGDDHHTLIHGSSGLRSLHSDNFNISSSQDTD